MSPELTEKLENRFTFLKRDPSKLIPYDMFSFEVLDGWYDLIFNLCEKIEAYYTEADAVIDLKALQIKEKFGVLQFYHVFTDYTKNKELHKKIDLAINEAENKSSTICEVCGELGSLRAELPWIKTLCDEHYNKKQQG